LKTPHILFSVVGGDFSDYKKMLRKLKIDTKWVRVEKKEHTATGFAMTDKANNQIWGFFYGASEKNNTLKIAEVAKPSDLVLIGPSGATASMSMVTQCIQLGISYMFDPGFILTQISKEDLQKGVSHAEYLIGNEYELDLIRQRVSGWKTIFAQKTIITTLGEK